MEKILSIGLLPIGFLVVLENLELFSISLPVDLVFVGSILMIVAQILTLLSVSKHHDGLRVVNYITSIILIVPALIYLANFVINFSFPELPLILGVMMFVEGTYSLH